MSPTTTLIRLKRLLLVGAVVAGAVVPAAQAVDRPPDVQDTASAPTASAPDVFERYAAIHQSLVSQPDIRDTSLTLRGMADLAVRPPDVQDTAISLAASAPDVVERFAIVHPDGLGVSSASVSRPPDISDTALAVQYGTVTQSSASFDWGDWAIGIGSGMGIALLLGAALLMARQLRRPVQAA
jgi:hypothetical protein